MSQEQKSNQENVKQRDSQKLHQETSTSNRHLKSAEQAIVNYLRTHPEFFNRHLDLLETLSIPHPCQPAVSLIERQLRQLRDHNTQLHKKLKELLDVARENGHLVNRMQRLTIMLIKQREIKGMLLGVKTVLREEFNADFITLQLTHDAAELAGEACLSANGQALFQSILHSGRPRCGRFTQGQINTLFGETGHHIASAALVPLRGREWCGLLGVGSQDEHHFHPGMGILFLKSMGELISQALQTHLYADVNVNDNAAIREP